jgi:hypothetical protein
MEIGVVCGDTVWAYCKCTLKCISWQYEYMVLANCRLGNSILLYNSYSCVEAGVKEV